MNEMNNEAIFFDKLTDAIGFILVAKKVSYNLLTEKEKEELYLIHKKLDVFTDTVAERLAKESETEK